MNRHHKIHTKIVIKKEVANLNELAYISVDFLSIVNTLQFLLEGNQFKSKHNVTTARWFNHKYVGDYELTDFGKGSVGYDLLIGIISGLATELVKKLFTGAINSEIQSVKEIEEPKLRKEAGRISRRVQDSNINHERIYGDLDRFIKGYDSQEEAIQAFYDDFFSSIQTEGVPYAEAVEHFFEKMLEKGYIKVYFYDENAKRIFDKNCTRFDSYI